MSKNKFSRRTFGKRPIKDEHTYNKWQNRNDHRSRQLGYNNNISRIWILYMAAEALILVRWTALSAVYIIDYLPNRNTIFKQVYLTGPSSAQASCTASTIYFTFSNGVVRSNP